MKGILSYDKLKLNPPPPLPPLRKGNGNILFARNFWSRNMAVIVNTGENKFASLLL